eukprot:767181-Hanusia_phi.AAC.1
MSGESCTDGLANHELPLISYPRRAATRYPGSRALRRTPTVTGRPLSAESEGDENRGRGCGRPQRGGNGAKVEVGGYGWRGDGEDREAGMGRQKIIEISWCEVMLGRKNLVEPKVCWEKYGRARWYNVHRFVISQHSEAVVSRELMRGWKLHVFMFIAIVTEPSCVLYSKQGIRSDANALCQAPPSGPLLAIKGSLLLRGGKASTASQPTKSKGKTNSRKHNKREGSLQYTRSNDSKGKIVQFIGKHQPKEDE